MGPVHAKSLDVEDREMDRPPVTKVDLTGLRAQVQQVHVNGMGRTKDDIVIKSVQGIFEAKDFQSVVLKIHDARNKLENLGCFSNIDVLVDTYEGSDANQEGIQVTFDVEEKKLVGFRGNASVGQNEGSVDASGLLKNVFGRGEEFSLNSSRGSKQKSSFSANFLKPLHNSVNTKINWSLYQSNYEMGCSGFNETDRGLLMNLMLNPLPNITQQLILETTWRHLACMSKSTAFAVREHSGHTLKNSIKHTVTYDGRDDSIFPTDGSLSRISNEVAGLGGNIGFVKNEVAFQTSLPLYENLVASTSFSAGHMFLLNGGKTCTISDRFFLGGPMNLRGFEMGGVGPHSEGFALGGQAYWNAGIHLYHPLPLLPVNDFTERFKLRAWINLGNISENCQDGKSASESLKELLMKQVRFTYGFGLGLNLANMARVELNYCIPLHAFKGDRVNRGLQFGISADVL